MQNTASHIQDAANAMNKSQQVPLIASLLHVASPLQMCPQQHFRELALF